MKQTRNRYCPKCKGILHYTTIVKVDDKARPKVIGINFYCTNINCKYEVDKPLNRRR